MAMATQGAVQLTTVFNVGNMMYGPLLHAAGLNRTLLSSLVNNVAQEGIAVHGRVLSITRNTFRCVNGSGHYAIGFDIIDETDVKSVFLFAPERNSLQNIFGGYEIRIEGAKFSNHYRFGNEIRALLHEGGSWQSWVPGA